MKGSVQAPLQPVAAPPSTDPCAASTTWPTTTNAPWNAGGFSVLPPFFQKLFTRGIYFYTLMYINCCDVHSSHNGVNMASVQGRPQGSRRRVPARSPRLRMSTAVPTGVWCQRHHLPEPVRAGVQVGRYPSCRTCYFYFHVRAFYVDEMFQDDVRMSRGCWRMLASVRPREH